MHEEYNADGLRVHCAHFTYTRTQKNFESQSFAIKAKAIKVDIPNVNVYMIFDTINRYIRCHGVIVNAGTNNAIRFYKVKSYTLDLYTIRLHRIILKSKTHSYPKGHCQLSFAYTVVPPSAS